MQNRHLSLFGNMNGFVSKAYPPETAFLKGSGIMAQTTINLQIESEETRQAIDDVNNKRNLSGPYHSIAELKAALDEQIDQSSGWRTL